MSSETSIFITTYVVNLVFKFDDLVFQSDRESEWYKKQKDISISYQLEGQRDRSIVNMAYKREDNWWTAELCQFTSDGPTFSLDITFQDNKEKVHIDGFEFQPCTEKVEPQVSEDQKQTESTMQLPISESDVDETYWEQKLPNDYQDIIKRSKDKLRWTTKKELYSIFSKGFLMVNYSVSQRLLHTGDQPWFSIDKSGKKCLKLHLIRACKFLFLGAEYTWHRLPESRFGEVLVLKGRYLIVIEPQNERHVLSPQTRYASYLVYKLPEDQSRNQQGLMKVSFTKFVFPNSPEFWYVFFHSPQTPVVRPMVGENTHNPAIRPKLKDLPQKRSDDWMEVQLCEFQVDTADGFTPGLKLQHVNDELEGLIIQCIEIRPI